MQNQEAIIELIKAVENEVQVLSSVVMKHNTLTMGDMSPLMDATKRFDDALNKVQ